MAQKLEIRGASGLGDTFYIYPVAEYYKNKGYDVLVRTKFPDVFRPLRIQTTGFYKIPKADITATYSNRKNQKTNQLQDVLINSNLPIDYDFKIDWTVCNNDLINNVKNASGGKKILIISMPHQPFDRPDRYGDALKPNFKNMEISINELKKGGWFIIQVGKGACHCNLPNIDLKKQNITSVSDLIDLCSIADGFIGQVGFIVPIAEIFKKPLLVLFSRAGLRSSDAFISAITGDKILSRESSFYMIDDEPEDRVKQLIDRTFN